MKLRGISTVCQGPPTIVLTAQLDMQMRAVLIKDGKGPAENLYIGEAPKPIPKSGEVLVKVNGSSHLTILMIPSLIYARRSKRLA